LYHWETCHIRAEDRVQKAELLAVDLLVLECTAPIILQIAPVRRRIHACHMRRRMHACTAPIILQIAPVNPFPQTNTTRYSPVVAERAQQATKKMSTGRQGKRRPDEPIQNLSMRHLVSGSLFSLPFLLLPCTRPAASRLCPPLVLLPRASPHISAHTSRDLVVSHDRTRAPTYVCVCVCACVFGSGTHGRTRRWLRHSKKTYYSVKRDLLPWS
jgi:hypothetical protein